MVSTWRFIRYYGCWTHEDARIYPC